MPNNRKIYNINNQEFGIDFNSVLCFYIDGIIDTYKGLNKKYLNIIIGSKFNEPSKIKLDYSQYILKAPGLFTLEIDKKVDVLYKDLIEYFQD